MSLDSRLSTESAYVFGVLSNFHLLDLLSEGCTVSVLITIVLVSFFECPIPKIPPVSFHSICHSVDVDVEF